MKKLRLVSLVPSLTKTLCDLGLEEEVVGITNFCILPPGLHKKAGSIGGTKDPDLEKIAYLRPTHIFVNQEENKPEIFSKLRAIAPTLVTFPQSPQDIDALVAQISVFLQRELELDLVQRTHACLNHLAEAMQNVKVRKRYIYLIWDNPYMAVGKDTYISRLLGEAGLENALSDGAEHYPKIDLAQMQTVDPDILLLSTEPFPFRKRHAQKIKELWPSHPPISKVDGQLASWHGSLTPVALTELLHWVQGKDQSMIQTMLP